MGYTPRAVGCGAPAGRSNKKIDNVCFPFQWHCSNKKGRGAQSFISNYFLLVDSSAVDISLVGCVKIDCARVCHLPRASVFVRVTVCVCVCTRACHCWRACVQV